MKLLIGYTPIGGEMANECTEVILMSRRGPVQSSVSRFLRLFAIASACFYSTAALSQQLAGSAIRELAFKGTWEAENDWGFWTWGDDSTVCLRVFGPEGDCADTGTWAIDGDVMCYELTWWGKAYDVMKNCYTVHSRDDGKFETRYHGGALDSVFTIFTVLD